MIKGIIKILLIVILIVILMIIYLSVIGIKTNSFNSQIKKNILKIDNKANFVLNEVTYLLNPYNFSVKATTENSQILIEDSELDIKSIKTNISLKSIINDKFSINNLQISTEEIELSDFILLARKIHNTPQLFILNSIIKDGSITVNIDINFDNQGKIKKNYQVEGFVKNTRLNLLNKFNFENLSFSFGVVENKYSLTEIDGVLNDFKIKSPLIKIKEKKGLYLINGTILNEAKKLDSKSLKPILGILLNDIDIRKLEFSSTNNFSFNINKKFKLNDLKVESIIDLAEVTFFEKRLNLKHYLPNFKEEIKFENHKIKIDYNKDKLNIFGNGNIFLTDRSEQLSYDIKKNNKEFLFNCNLIIKNNPLIIKFLDYEKKEGNNSIISINGNLKKNGSIKFKSISLKENKNKILIKDLELSQTYKIVDIGSINIDYKNNKNIHNKLDLNKNSSNFVLEGESFDATKFINNLIAKDKEGPSIFKKLNTNIEINIKKTYIDKINYINNLSGYLSFKDNEIKNLELVSFFPNKKKINLAINTNDSMETTTSLSTDYPKPLIKRYNFIKGFEGGYLNFNSVKKDNISKSLLIIDNFKVQEVPVLAKLLSLASLQGIADILTGEGVRFTDLEMKFSNQKNLITIEEMYAIGPAISILMDGYIENNKLFSLRGTLVPATTINRSIASIPLLGKILIGDKTGEGVFGVSFKIKGSSKNLSTTVDPIKTLTPRFITRTLEKIKK